MWMDRSAWVGRAERYAICATNEPEMSRLKCGCVRDNVFRRQMELDAHIAIREWERKKIEKKKHPKCYEKSDEDEKRKKTTFESITNKETHFSLSWTSDLASKSLVKTWHYYRVVPLRFWNWLWMHLKIIIIKPFDDALCQWKIWIDIETRGAGKTTESEWACAATHRMCISRKSGVHHRHAA